MREKATHSTCLHFKERHGSPWIKISQTCKRIIRKMVTIWKLGLTKETFLAYANKIPKLAFHLIKSHRFRCVLSGKFLIDLLEGFGWYKQANGGNFLCR